MTPDGSEGTLAPDVRLRDYGTRRRQLAELLQSAIHLASEERDEGSQRRARGLLSNLAEDRFQLAVVGQFSRGKSTLMNAVLGGTYLPTGALPMTSVVTTVRYGSNLRVEVHPEGDGLPISTTLSDLPRYIAQSSPDRERLRIVAANIELPAEILRLGFSFVDTPGIGSAVVTNTQTTRRYLPDADAVVFVSSAESPLTADEMDLFARARHNGRRIFFVLNKIDLVADAAVPDLIAFVRERLGSEGETEIPIFPISARWALEGRESHDPDRLEASGVRSLEEQLVRFLTTEKSRELLLRTTDRTRDLVQRQRLEWVLRLSLGRGGIDPQLRDLLQQRVDELCAAEQQAAHRLATMLSETLRARLVQRASRWGEVLELELLPCALKAAHSAAARSLRITQADVQRHFENLAQESLEEWGSGWADEVRGVVAELSLPALTALARDRDSVDAVVLAALGAAPPAAAPPSAEFPNAAMRSLMFNAPSPTLAGDWPWWATLAPTAWSRGRVLEWVAPAVRRGIARSLDQAISQAVESAAEWAQACGVHVQTETRKAAGELQERLTSAGRNADLGRFDALLERLDRLTSDLKQPVGEGRTAPAVSAGQVSARKPCPVCRELEAVLSNYLAAVQFDLLHDDDRRAEHARGGGFCALHTWQYAQVASPLGIAAAYAPVVERAARLLQRTVEAPPDQTLVPGGLAEIVLDRGRCPACSALASAERQAIIALLADRGWQDDRSDVPALCAPHLAVVLAADPPPEVAHRLQAALAAYLERAAEDMRGYALKRDSFRRDLITDEESIAAVRALGRLVGSPALEKPTSDRDEI